MPDEFNINVTAAPGDVDAMRLLLDGVKRGPQFDTVPDMLASERPALAVGEIWKAAGLPHATADPGASDHHMTTAGGVKLYRAYVSDDGCVLRNDGTGWTFIDDANHAPRGFSSLDVNVTEQYALTVHRDFVTHQRVTAFAAVDETLARVGVCVGPSVNAENMRLHFSAPLTLRFAATATPSITDVSAFHESHTEVSWDGAAREFVIDHLDCGLSGQAQATYEYTAKDEVILPAVRRVNGAQHRVAIYDRMEGVLQWDGTSSWTVNNREIARAGGDQTGYSVSALSGGPDFTFTVAHPELASEYGEWPVNVFIIGKSHKYVPFVTSVTRTGFAIQLWDLSAGAVATSLPASALKIGFSREWYRLPRPITGHIAVSLPNTRIDPEDLVSANGNVWIGSSERTSDKVTEPQ